MTEHMLWSIEHRILALKIAIFAINLEYFDILYIKTDNSIVFYKYGAFGCEINKNCANNS